MMRFGLFGGAAMLIFAATAPAQTTLLPRQCAGMTGDQLDLCVRNITLPQMVPTIEDVAVKPDPAQPMDCATVTRADEDYCIARNQIVIECRKRNKYPDFEQCANPLAAAQAKPPVYVITDIIEITDAEGYKVIAQRSAADAAANFKEFGGRYLVRTDRVTALDGTAPKRLIIAAFDSTEKAQAWANSKHQKEVTAIRVKNTKSRSFIVEGM